MNTSLEKVPACLGVKAKCSTLYSSGPNEPLQGTGSFDTTIDMEQRPFRDTEQRSAAQVIAAHHATALHGTAGHSVARNSTVWHSTAQHSA